MDVSNDEYDESNLPPEIAAIVDEDSLYVYLKRQPNKVSQIIAWRLAMRVFPIVFMSSHQTQIQQRQFKQLTIQVFRSLFISSFVHKYSDDELINSTIGAAIVSAAVAAGGAVANDGARAVGAGADARAAGAAAYTAVAAFTSVAVYAAVAADVARAANDHTAIWRVVRFDINQLGQNTTLIFTPLWGGLPLDDMPIPILYRLQYALEQRDKDLTWGVVFDWYTALLPLNKKIKPRLIFDKETQYKLAIQLPNFWGDKQNRDGKWEFDPVADPDEVMQRIADLVGFPDHATEKPSGDLDDVDQSELSSTLPNYKPIDRAVPHIIDGEFDALGRAPIAMSLVQLINDVWQVNNRDDVNQPYNNPRWFFKKRKTYKTDEYQLNSGFVVHVDAPWGGGKTTFVQYVLRILNPYRYSDDPPPWLETLNLQAAQKRDANYRIPWQIIEFDAWQHCHVDPPWWTFWQNIYEQSLKSKKLEQNEQGSKYEPPHEDYDYNEKPWTNLKFGAFWLKDIVWRFWTPQAKFYSCVAAVIAFILFVLFQTEILTPSTLKEPVSVVVAILGAVGLVYKALIKSLLPGTPQAAKNFALGSGDPLDRFRLHFESMMKDVHRPVLVVVDNLDRCPPKYVVELIHGMQTILTSKRVIFLMLGDRDWIEKSFEIQYKDMKSLIEGDEKEFGARFVEKAIQLSFTLPDMTADDKDTYIRHILGITEYGLRLEPEDENSPEKIELANIARELDDIDDFAIRRKRFEEVTEQIQTNDTLDDETKSQRIRGLSERITIREASDSGVQDAIESSLAAAVPILPANPRQINLIVSKIALIQSIANIKIDDFDFGGAKWQMLVRWIILADTHPKTWFTLSKHPILADALWKNAKAIKALKSESVHTQYLKMIEANAGAEAILDFKPEGDQWDSENVINQAAVEWLVQIMPPTSGNLLDLEKSPKE